MRVSSNFTTRRLYVPGLVLGLIAASLLPSGWAIYTHPLANAATVFLYPAVWVNTLGARLRGQPQNLAHTNLETLGEEHLKLEGLLLQKDAEIRRLKEENAHLAGLRRSIGGSYKYIQARVIGRSIDSAAVTLKIDVGSRHGLRLGMVVVEGPNLVGRIVQVFHSSAVVQPITAPGSSVKVAMDTPDIRDEPLRILLLQSAGQDKLESDEVEAATPIKIGDLARLADDNRFNPWPQVAQFMIVGEVVAVEQDPDHALWQRVQVRPRKPLFHLTEVTVLAPDEEPPPATQGDQP